MGDVGACAAADRLEPGGLRGRADLRLVPYHSSHVIGHLNLASHQWLPLYVLATLCLLDSIWPPAVEDGWRHGAEQARPWRWALIAGCAAAAVVLTEITYAAFLPLWTGFYLLY